MYTVVIYDWPRLLTDTCNLFAKVKGREAKKNKEEKRNAAATVFAATAVAITTVALLLIIRVNTN